MVKQIINDGQATNLGQRACCIQQSTLQSSILLNCLWILCKIHKLRKIIGV